MIPNFLSKTRTPKRPKAPQDWGTPQPAFAWANRRWGNFHIDLAASEWNQKCGHWLDEGDDALDPETSWQHPAFGTKTRGWLNAPWNFLTPFVERAFEEVKSGRMELVCLFVPTRTGQAWWLELAVPFGEVKLIRGRIPFVAPPDVHDSRGGFEDAAFVVFERQLLAENLRGA